MSNNEERDQGKKNNGSRLTQGNREGSGERLSRSFYVTQMGGWKEIRKWRFNMEPASGGSLVYYIHQCKETWNYNLHFPTLFPNWSLNVYPATLGSTKMESRWQGHGCDALKPLIPPRADSWTIETLVFEDRSLCGPHRSSTYYLRRPSRSNPAFPSRVVHSAGHSLFSEEVRMSFLLISGWVLKVSDAYRYYRSW